MVTSNVGKLGLFSVKLSVREVLLQVPTGLSVITGGVAQGCISEDSDVGSFINTQNGAQTRAQ